MTEAQYSNPPMSARFILAAFLAVSLIVHIMILLYQPDGHNIELGSDNTNQISIYIRPNEVNGSDMQNPVRTSSATTPNTPSENIGQYDDKHAGGNLSQLELQASLREKKILGQIQQELARFFYYPPQAVRRSLQGKVIIGFQLSHLGKINTVTINQSSGHMILDNAALDAFHQAAKIFTASIMNDAIDLQIPVIFQLSGG